MPNLTSKDRVDLDASYNKYMDHDQEPPMWRYDPSMVRMDLYKRCINFLDTRIELDQTGFKFDVFEH